jgi:hypothetical protein
MTAVFLCRRFKQSAIPEAPRVNVHSPRMSRFDTQVTFTGLNKFLACNILGSDQNFELKLFNLQYNPIQSNIR